MNPTQDAEHARQVKEAMEALDARVRERTLLSRAAPGDRLMLADATMLSALDGSRVLTPNERQALEQSPLTLRRFRQLSLQRRSAAQTAQPAQSAPAAGLSATQAANDAAWSSSSGMLRAASSAVALESLVTDDNYWTLHFVPKETGAGWQLILALAAEAPFAARLLREQAMLRVVDGGGTIVLQGRLDADGECERSWPFETEPAPHFQLYGAVFSVEPAAS